MLNKPVVLLLIDDDEDDRHFFEIAIADLQFEVICETVSEARQALSMLNNKSISPDFIFLDLNMPAIDGRTCLKQLKSNPDTANTPVIIFSTSSEKADVESVKALGAIHFMTKPADINQLSIDLNNFFVQHFENRT